MLATETWVGSAKPTTEHGNFSSYFNIDNGTGPILGWYAQNNEAAKALFAVEKPDARQRIRHLRGEAGLLLGGADVLRGLEFAAEKDRLAAEQDFKVNLKSELMLEELMRKSTSRDAQMQEVVETVKSLQR